jgi:hypothetical protein
LQTSVQSVPRTGTYRKLTFVGARVVVIDKELERCFFTAGGTL